jgi:hypothetical protein
MDRRTLARPGNVHFLDRVYGNFGHGRGIRE